MGRRFAVGLESLKWKPAAEVWNKNANEGVSIKLLREDLATGGYVALVRLVPGTTASLNDHRFTQEQFLIDGMIIEAGVERRAPAYWSIPFGEISGKTYTPSGATIVLICDGDTRTIDGAAMGRPMVVGVAVDALEWKPIREITPYYPQESLDRIRALGKLLSRDPDTGRSVA